MKKVSRKQAKELAALARMPDEKIDLTDAPEVREWRGSHQKAGDDPRGRRCAGVAEAARAWLPDKDQQALREAMEGKRRRA